MIYEQEELLCIWMMLSAGDGTSLLYRTVGCFNAAEQVYNCDKRSFGTAFSEEEVEKFANKDLDAAKRVVDYCERNGIRIIPFSSMEYPLSLRNLANSPCALFVKGNFELSEERPSVGIVGTRNATDSGKSLTAAISYELSSAGVTVVSGMAKGIDTQAHKSSLYLNNPTVAVVAGGVDVVYPAENRELYELIQRNGAVISEHLPGTATRPFLFHMRNRLIAALSDAVIVVESDAKGGSLITAECAIKQGIPLFAVPGPITSQESIGTNRLIKNRDAYMFTKTDDVIEVLNKKHGGSISVTKRSNVAMSFSKKEDGSSKKKAETEEIPSEDFSLLLFDTVQFPKMKPKKKAPPEPVPAKPTPGDGKPEYEKLSELEKRIYDHIWSCLSCTVDDICDKMPDLTFTDVVIVLGKLELEGLVRNTGFGNYKAE